MNQQDFGAKAFDALSRTGAIKDTCPACNERGSWRVPGTPAAIAAPEGWKGEPETMAVLACNTCGFTQFFHAKTLLAQ